MEGIDVTRHDTIRGGRDEYRSSVLAMAMILIFAIACSRSDGPFLIGCEAPAECMRKDRHESDCIQGTG